jgi:hypothetical protein
VEKTIQSIEARLEELRERVMRARVSFDSEVRSVLLQIDIQAEKTRNLANEALAEIRHLSDELGRL